MLCALCEEGQHADLLLCHQLEWHGHIGKLVLANENVESGFVEMM